MLSNIGNDLPEEFVFYLSDFNKLWQTTYDAINKVERPEYKDSYVYQILSQLDGIVSIDSEDIVQELACIWLKAIKNYNNSKPDCSIKQYLIRMSVWGLRDWLQKESNIPMSAPLVDNDNKEDDLFDLDLSFLFYGTNHHVLSKLTDYERYLIYLKYVEDKHIIEIAKHLQKDRSIVSEQLNIVHDKLRSMFDENTK